MGLDGSEIKSCCNQRLNMKTTTNHVEEIFKWKKVMSTFQVHSVHRFCEQQAVEGRSGKVPIYSKSTHLIQIINFCPTGSDGDGQDWTTPSFFLPKHCHFKRRPCERAFLVLIILNPLKYMSCPEMSSWKFLCLIFSNGISKQRMQMGKQLGKT